MKKTISFAQGFTAICVIIIFASCTKEMNQPVKNPYTAQDETAASKITIKGPTGYTGGTNTSDSTKVMAGQ